MEKNQKYIAIALLLICCVMSMAFIMTKDDKQKKDESKIIDNINNEDYAKALEGVEAAEELLTTDQVDIARSLVKNVDNEKQQKALSSRLNDVEQTIKATAVIDTLESMLTSASSKEDINTAAIYKNEVARDAVELIDGYKTFETKTLLTEKLEKLSKILEDEKAPVISGLVKVITKNDVSINFKDDNEYNVVITKNNKEIEYQNTFTEEGNYVVTVTDVAFNTTTAEFIIDKSAPVLSNVPNNKTVNYEIKPNIIEPNIKSISLTKDGKELEEYKKAESKTIRQEGDYILTVVDKAGNKTSHKFSIDTTKPELTVTTSNNDGATTAREVYVTITSNESIEAPSGWTQESDKVITRRYTKNIRTSVTVNDLAGNKVKVDYRVKGVKR